MSTRNKLDAYQQVNNQAAQAADPHRLIQMLMDGFITRAAAGRIAMEERDFDRKGRELGRALTILSGLRDTLDHDRGGETAAGLESLYAYMQRGLLRASAANDQAAVDEAIALMREIKAGWDGIRDQVTDRTGAPSAPPVQGGVRVSG